MKIVLVGCGNVGSRHLQALVKLKYQTTIYIIEPDKNSQKIAKKRLTDIRYSKNNHKIIWLNSLSDLDKKSDVVIVATHSKGRVDIIKKLLLSGHKRFLIEKFVCQSTAEYNNLLSLIKKFNAKGWVNTNLQCFDGYQKIKKCFKPNEPISLSVLTNSKYGLSTQAIHYLALFSWLTENNKIKLDGKYLKKELIHNKRSKSFKEFQGTLTGINDNDSFLNLTFLPSFSDSLIVKISGAHMHFILDEINSKILVFNENKPKKWYFEFEHVSNLTTKIIDDILKKDSCLLPSVQDSFNHHSELFRIFNAHLRKILNKDFKLCPIT
ncbi:Gfo/Idh/MocA family oxidoreductase [Nitrosopumilus sp. b2]|uniref:Gfo/Idh/MocA family oxidoreductase n=1 Tax=Nitrosopumilus sp. b2 TaxID=2109908 RepID=UPI0015F75452|nr:Gfo/Idh/MocA family oxidoreductase [Nitrosopumilus sp. b2]